MNPRFPILQRRPKPATASGALPVPTGLLFVYNGSLQQADLDGNNVQTLFSERINQDYCYDYGSQWFFSPVDYRDLTRRRFDGSSRTQFTVDGAAFLQGIDVYDGTVYVSDRNSGNLFTMDLDGSNQQSHPVTFRGIRIRVDRVRGKVWWTDLDQGIYKANLDFTGREQVIAGGGRNSTSGLALDVKNERVYWSDNSEPTASPIRRANYDGSGASVIVADTSGASPVVDEAHGALYFMDAGNSIRKANLDGSGASEIVADASHADLRLVR